MNKTLTPKEIFENSCKGIDESKFKIETSLIDKSRSYFESSLKGLSSSLDTFLEKNDPSVFTSNIKDLLVYIIPIGLILLCTLISFIFFIINICLCCCKPKKENANAKRWFLISIIVWIIFIFCFIIFIVFLSMIMTSIKKFNCSINRIPYHLFEGKTYDDVNFIGFNKLTGFLDFIFKELDGLKSNKTRFDKIKQQNLPDKANEAQKRVDDSKPILSPKKVFNPSNKQSETPLSIANYNTSISPTEGEISGLKEISQSLHDTAIIFGDKFANQDSNQFKSSVDKAKEQISGIEVKISGIFSKIQLEGLDNYLKFAIYGNIGFGLLLLILTVFIFLISWLRFYKNKLQNCAFLARFLIFCSGFFTFILTLVMIIIFILYLMFTLICGVYSKFLGGNYKPLEKYISSDSDSLQSKALKTCVYPNGSGNFENIINLGNNEDLDSMNKLIDGLSTMINKFSDYTNIGSSPTIKTYKEELGKILSQVNNDFNGIPTLLADINNLGCSKTISFSEAGCPSAGNCLLIQKLSDTSFSSSAGCSNQTKADELFRDLKKYDNEDTVVVEKIISELNSINIKISAVYTGFDSVNSDVIAIKNNISNLVEKLKEFKSGFLKSLDCRILRKELEQIESTLCFSFAYNLFPLTVSMILLTYLLCILNWSLCCLVRNSSVSKEEDNNKNFEEK